LVFLSGHLSGIRRRDREQPLTATIWTIGHGDRSFDQIERHLTDLGISMIVDVRHEPDDPSSTDFRRRRIERLAADAGIGYRWLGASLGSDLPADRRAGLADLMALASMSATVVLCRETDAAACRRSTVIAPMLSDRGIDVVHILADGSRRRHETPLPFDP
jgi:uncharacterized protein (DUF488 family)